MPSYQPKIALIGSGNIGGTVAMLSGLQSLTNNIVFLDVVEGIAEGKALDLVQGLASRDFDCATTGCSNISPTSEALKDADICIVTAGFPRKPGMTREDLLVKNGEVITGVANAIKAQCPNAFIICITNPLDVMVALLQKVSGIPPARVVGMAGVLDTSRFRYFLSQELKVSVHDVHSLVLGGHGDLMVPLRSATSVNGVPLATLVKMGMITDAKVDEIVERTRQGGGEIVTLLKFGSAFVAPAMCAVQMAQAYIRDERRVLPCCVHISNSYGITDMYSGVPCIIGKNGVEKIIELPLEGHEAEDLRKSFEAVAASRDECRKLGFQI